MNISAETIKSIEDLYHVWYSDDNYNKAYVDKATILHVSFSKTEEPEYLGKALKTPKKQEVTLDWVLNKLNADSVYKSFASTFQRMLKDSTLNVYPTTYGIGVFVLFNFRGINEENKERY